MKILVFLIGVSIVIFSVSAQAQIYVANENGTVGEYNLDGTTVNASLITGLSDPQCIATSGNDLFIGETNGATGWISEYDLDGTPVSTSLITSQSGDGITAIAVSGNDLIFGNNSTISNTISECTTTGVLLTSSLIPTLGGGSPGVYGGVAGAIVVSGEDMFITVGVNGNNEISEYTTSGELLNKTLLTGVGTDGLALAGSNLFVSSYIDDTLGEYTTSGGAVITNINALTDNVFENPDSLAISGSDLFIADSQNQGVGEYSLDGTLVNGNLLSDSNVISGIAVVSAVPEPSTWAMLAAGVGLMMFGIRRRRL